MKTVTIVLESLEDARTYAKCYYLALTWRERSDRKSYDCTFVGRPEHINEMLEFVS